MQLSKVVWEEGMYLAPQHFQAQAQYGESLTWFVLEQLWFAPYGFLGLALDDEALRNDTLALEHARGVFPDGLVFQMPEYDLAPPVRNIADSFPPMRDTMDVYLAVPKRKHGAANCLLARENESGCKPGRLIAHSVTLVDDNSGLDPKVVHVGRKNIRFLLDSEIETGDASDDEVLLRVARLRRTALGRFARVEHFVPPVLQIGASPVLAGELHKLLVTLEEKARMLVRPKDLAMGTVSGFSAEGISNAWFLHCINASVGPLRHMLGLVRVHPEQLFLELVRLAGALCTFSVDSHPARLPSYDHESLAECFGALIAHILSHLELAVPSNVVQIRLNRGAQYFWEGSVVDERAVLRSRWILGIRCELGESELMERTPRLVKLCSKEFVPRLVERAIPGLKLTHLAVPPPALQPKIGFQYFLVDRSGPCWEHLVKTREVGLYVPGELPNPELDLTAILES